MKCSECKAWSRFDETSNFRSKLGECRKRPPVIALFGNVSRTLWPITKESEWCLGCVPISDSG